MNKSNLGPMLLLVALVIGFIALVFPVAFGYVLIALLGAACLAAVLMVAYVIYWFARNRLSPVVRTEATVVRKRSVPWDVTIPALTPEMSAARLGTMGRHPGAAAKAYVRSAASSDIPEIEIADGSDFFVTFRVGGREVEFIVPEETYIKAEESTSGLLVFRGEQFMHFILPVSSEEQSGM